MKKRLKVVCKPSPDRETELKESCADGSWAPPDDITDDIIPGPKMDRKQNHQLAHKITTHKKIANIARK